MSNKTDKKNEGHELLVSRRRFGKQMAAVAGAGFVLSNGGILIQSAYAQNNAAATPKKGGVLRMGMSGGTSSDSLDPRTYSDEITITTSVAVLDSLVELDEKGDAKPCLLESWEADAEYKRWVFEVRKDIRFTSGKVLDADDIIYSVMLHMGKSKSGAQGVLSVIKDIKKLSPSQVQFTLDQGNIDFPWILADYHLMVVPKDFTNWSRLDGTGPYRIEKFEPGVQITLKAKGNYWRPNYGNFDAVEILYINDKMARTSALQSGKIDVANRLDPRTANLLSRNSKIKVARTPGAGLRYCFTGNSSMPPYADRNLLLALKYGVDRKKIVDSVFGGYATIANDHNLSPSHTYFNRQMPQRAYDPDKAAFYFKKANLGTSKLELQTSEGAWDSAVDCAVLYQESLKKAGITLDLKKVSADGYWDNIWMKQAFCASYWSARPTVDLQFSTSYKSDSTWNDSHWKNKEFDSLLIAARVERDEQKRREMYGRCQELIAEDSASICFAIGDFLAGHSTRLMGSRPHPRDPVNRMPLECWFA